MWLRRCASVALATVTVLMLTAGITAEGRQSEVRRPAGTSTDPASPIRGASADQPRAPRGGLNLRSGDIADWKWWQDPDTRRALELSDDKVALLERLFQKQRADMQPYVALLRLEREKLDRMTRERTASLAEYTAQVSRVWDIYSWTQESRVVMLYAMYRELRPEQYTALLELFRQRSASSAPRPTSPNR